MGRFLHCVPLIVAIFLLSADRDALAKDGKVPVARLQRLASIPNRERPSVFLSYPLDVSVSDSGEIYVCDHDLSCVLKFGADGRFIRQIGRRGAGPGELNGPAAIDLHGDSVFVADGGNMRVVIFDTAGTYLGGFPIQHRLSSIVYKGRWLYGAWDGTFKEVTKDTAGPLVRYDTITGRYETLGCPFLRLFSGMIELASRGRVTSAPGGAVLFGYFYYPFLCACTGAPNGIRLLDLNGVDGYRDRIKGNYDPGKASPKRAPGGALIFRPKPFLAGLCAGVRDIFVALWGDRIRVDRLSPEGRLINTYLGPRTEVVYDLEVLQEQPNVKLALSHSDGELPRVDIFSVPDRDQPEP